MSSLIIIQSKFSIYFWPLGHESSICSSCGSLSFFSLKFLITELISCCILMDWLSGNCVLAIIAFFFGFILVVVSIFVSLVLCSSSLLYFSLTCLFRAHVCSSDSYFSSSRKISCCSYVTSVDWRFTSIALVSLSFRSVRMTLSLGFRSSLDMKSAAVFIFPKSQAFHSSGGIIMVSKTLVTGFLSVSTIVGFVVSQRMWMLSAIAK